MEYLKNNKTKKFGFWGGVSKVLMLTLVFGAYGKTADLIAEKSEIHSEWMTGLLMGKDMSDLSASYAAKFRAENLKNLAPKYTKSSNPMVAYIQAEQAFFHELGRLLKVKSEFEQKHQTYLDEKYALLEKKHRQLQTWFQDISFHSDNLKKSTLYVNKVNDFKGNIEMRWQVLSHVMKHPLISWNVFTRWSLDKLITQKTVKSHSETDFPIILRNSHLPFSNRKFSAPTLVFSPQITPTYADEHASDGVVGDLVSDEMVSLTPEIYELAASLEYDYIKIYNFVRQQITEQYYAGSMKGSQGTLLSYAGNDVDQAALLMALFRASNIPAHFVQGVIQQPIDRAANGLGLSHPNQVLEALNRAGIPHVPVIQGGQITAVQKQYTWVSAFVPYAHYRGSANDLNNPVWIPLAPAIKQISFDDHGFEYTDAGIDENQWVENYLTESSSTPHEPLAEWRELVQQEFTGDYESLLTEVQNTTKELNVLPASLPFEVIVTTYEGAVFLTEQLHHLNIELNNGGQSILMLQIPLVEVSGRRISLSYLPATVNDMNIINQSGGMSQVPPYLVDLRPVIKVDGRQIETNSAIIPMAALHDLKLSLTSPSGSVEVERKLLAGTYMSIVLGTQDDDYPLNTEDVGLINDETKPIRLIHNLGVNYHKLWNEAEKELAAVMNQAIIRPLPSISLLSPEFNIIESNGLPIIMQFAGISLDAITRSVDVVSRSDVSHSSWMRLSSLQGSWLESSIFDSQWAVPAISADQGIRTQAMTGETVFHITADNINSVLPVLNHPNNIKEHIQGWVNTGFEVMVPENLINQGVWQGSNWHIWHPESGDSGYFIAGGYAGGITTQQPDEWEMEGLSEMLFSPYAEGANEDPFSAIKIVVLESTNNQVGLAGQQIEHPTQVLVTDAIGRPVVGAQVIFKVEGINLDIADSNSYILDDQGNTAPFLDKYTDSRGMAEIDVILAKKIFYHQLKLLDAQDENETRVGFANFSVAVNSSYGLLSPGTQVKHMIIPGTAHHIEIIECYQYTDPCIPEGLFGTMAAVMHASVRDEYDNFVSNVPVEINLSPGTELLPGATYDLLTKDIKSSASKSTPENNQMTVDENVASKAVIYHPGFESAKVALVGECATEPNYLPPECAVDHTSPEGLSYLSGPSWQTMNIYNGIPTEIGLGWGNDHHYYEFPVEFIAQGIEPVIAKTYGKQTYENIFQPSIFLFKDRYQFGPYGNYVTATPNQSLSIHAGLFRSMGSWGGLEYVVVKMHEPTQGYIYPYEIINEVLSGPATQEFIVNPDGFDFRLVEPGSDYGRTRYRTTFKSLESNSATQFEVAFNTFSDTAKIEFTSITPNEIILDEQSYLTHPISITTAITPFEFRPLNLVFKLLENNEVIHRSLYLHPSSDKFSTTFLAGMYLNPESTYEIEVVMNEGNDYEVSSGRVNLTNFSSPLIGSISGSNSFNGMSNTQNGGEVINGQIIAPISISQEIDLANALVCGYNQININILNDSNVTLNLEKYGLDGQLTGDVINILSETVLSAGDHQIEVSPAQLGNHQYQIQMNATAVNANNDEYITGVLISKFDIDNSLPIGHALVKGVDLADGSMVYSKQDISLASPGVDLEFIRTYSSQGRHNLGPMGYGWSYNFMSRVIVGNCGQVTVTGADGGSARFQAVGGQFVPLKGFHSSLIFNEDGSFDFYPKGGIRYHYIKMQGNVWWMDYVEDPNGNRITVELVPRNNAPIIRSVTDAVGRRLFFEYEIRDFGLYSSEMLVMVKGPNGIKLTFDYDEIGNLKSASREGDTTNELLGYTGDITGPSRSLLLSVSDQATDAVRSWTYQAHSIAIPAAIGSVPDIASIEVTSITETDAGSTVFDFTDGEGYNSGATVNQNGQVSIYTLNSYGAATEIVSPAGTKTFNWNTDTDVLLMSETDENGRLRTFEYDAFGNVTQEQLGALVSSYTYYAPDVFDPPYIKDRIKTHTNWRGDVTSYEYDLVGNKINEELGQVTTLYTYDNMGLVKNITDGRGLVSTITYGSFGYQKSMRNPAGDIVKTLYNSRGQKVSQSDANNNTTTFSYDTSDRVISKYLSNKQWTYGYENGGRTRIETDPNDHDTTYNYDTQGRLLSTTNAKADTFTYVYDLNGNKTSETDFGGHVTTFAYDGANRLKTKTESQGSGGSSKVTTYDYDNVGNVLSETTADRITEYGYDPNRYFQTSITRKSSEGDAVITRTVDGNGNVLTETDPNSNLTTYTYDAFDRMLTMTGPLGSRQVLTYDGNGNVETTEVFNSTGNQLTSNSYDLANRLATVTLPMGGVMSYTYDKNGNITTETKPGGYSATYRYNELNLPLSKVINGHQWQLTYDDAGNLKQESGPFTSGEITEITNFIEYTYDELNRQISQSDSIGAISTQTYDADSNIATQTDGNGILVSYEYNDLHQRTDEIMPLGRSRSYSYNVFDEVLTETTPAPSGTSTLTHSYDQLGRRKTSTGPNGYSMSYTYDLNGNLSSQTDSKSITTTFGINALNQTESQQTSSYTMTMGYDTVGNLLSQTDYRGIISDMTYDLENRQTTITRAGLLQSTTTYNLAGLPVIQKDARGNNTVHEYNNQYHKTRTLLPESQVISYTPNSLGDVTLQNNPGPNDITRTYDARRRLKTEANGADETITYEYDLNNNRTAVIKPEGQRWEYDFDVANRLTAVRNVPEEIETIYGYDAADNLESITDSENKVTTFTFDDRKRKKSKTYPDTQFISYDYDANSNLDQVTYPNGVIVDFEYDDLNRQYQQDYSGTYGTASVTLTLDGNGNVEQVAEIVDGSNHGYTMDYDDLDRMESKTDRYGNTFFYTYDANGNRKLFRDHDNKVTNYDYDKLNRLKQLSQAGLGNFVWTYDAAGLPERIAYPNGSAANYLYDDANRIALIDNTQSGVTVTSHAYEYDANGNRDKLTESNIDVSQITSYEYDDADRLTKVFYPTKVASYTLDKVGNRELEVIDAGGILTTRDYQYNNRDQLTSVTDNDGLDISYDYDEFGNQTEKTQNGTVTTTITAFDYTARQRVKSITIGAASPNEYQYDYAGQRVNAQTGGMEKRYLYDGLTLIAETNAIGNTLATYHYGTRHQLAETRNSVNSYYLADALGTNVAITNQDGSIQNRMDYDVWGNLNQETASSDSPFGFTGYIKDDETDLYYANARYYDSFTGRFLREDPLEGDVNTPPSLHRYLYAASNPAYYIDPTGLAQEPGHFYEEYFEARAAGLSVDDSFAVAFFSQGPDEHTKLDAFSNTINFKVFTPSGNKYTRENNAAQHGLTGLPVTVMLAATEDYLLNFAKSYSDVGSVRHARTDAGAFHFPKDQIGLSIEERVNFNDFFGHGLAEGHSTDDSLLYPTKVSEAFFDGTIQLYKYATKNGIVKKDDEAFAQRVDYYSKLFFSVRDRVKERAVIPIKSRKIIRRTGVYSINIFPDEEELHYEELHKIFDADTSHQFSTFRPENHSASSEWDDYLSSLSEKQLRNLLELPNPASNRNRFSRELLVDFIERRALNSSRNVRNFNMKRIEDARKAQREERQALIKESKAKAGVVYWYFQ